MLDKRALVNDLADLFIGYQYRLDNPMPSANETEEDFIAKYRSDHIFNAKVNSLVAAVMDTIHKHEQ